MSSYTYIFFIISEIIYPKSALKNTKKVVWTAIVLSNKYDGTSGNWMEHKVQNSIMEQ